MNHPLLDSIQSPDDLRALDECDMSALAAEIRDFLIETIPQTGGHLASNLGVVELTLALHRTFDFKKDRLVFDVGHQCYIHKLLTGRKDDFATLRTYQGLSGFPKIAESDFDAFGTGHSSTSLSAALGISEALHLSGSDAYTVAVIGDGAFTGGMIHEALNNVKRDRRLILILNENEMSISRNIGAFAEQLARIRASNGYYKTKNRTATFISRIPLVGKGLFRFFRFVKQSLKNLFYGSNLFENLGLYYLGPVDGNDYAKVELLLREAVSYGKSVVIHVHTKKGKGYEPAENEPGRYHGVAPAGQTQTGEKFSSRLGKLLAEMGKEDSDICAITAAMGQATGLESFRTAFSERFFDVGIAESHALTFAAGLAAQGKKPVFAVYSSFLQRGYDNLLHDIALQSLPVTVLVDRAGLSAGDGPTHHGIFDVAFLSQIPHARIFAPATFDSLEAALRTALASKDLCAIRYANGGECIGEDSPFLPAATPLAPRVDFASKDAPERVIVTYGALVGEALRAKALLGAGTGVVLLETLTPYGEVARDLVKILPESVKILLIVEEGIAQGGFAMLLSHALRPLLPHIKIKTLGIVEPFAPDKSKATLMGAYGIGAEEMEKEIKT